MQAEGWWDRVLIVREGIAVEEEWEDDLECLNVSVYLVEEGMSGFFFSKYRFFLSSSATCNSSSLGLDKQHVV